ncbi:MAG TPA: hypothetical protein VEH29_15180, partial [Acidimicrobiales bacterium]|nr:hypothetical protein [Acidimicrobiales bacterium]
AARFVPDVRVSGTATWNRATSTVTADLALTGLEGAGSLRVTWSTDVEGALARETGTIGGKSVSLEMPAPFSAHG